MSVDLSSPGVAKGLARKLKDDIDSYCANKYDDGQRSHLGASLIGHECKRYLWFTFRWVYHHKFSGRQQRLFNRGHKEEARFLEWLRGIGCEVWEFERVLWYHAESDCYFIDRFDMQRSTSGLDAGLCIDCSEEPAHIEAATKRGVEFIKGKAQFRISGVMGHFGGSLDGMMLLPESYDFKNKVLAEFKTSGDKPFTKLEKEGMKIDKETHFCQTSIYGYKYGLKYCAYLSINKNNDELHIELVELDFELGKRLEEKAEEIITSQVAPVRMSNSSAFFKCKFCDYINVCFNKQPLELNCRSCVNAKAVDNAEWFCMKHRDIIPKDFIFKACDNWKAIY